MDISAAQHIGDFDWLEHADEKDEAAAFEKLRKKASEGRVKWQVEVGFKNIVVITIIMLPYRVQNMISNSNGWSTFLCLLWYAVLFFYFWRSYQMHPVPGKQIKEVIKGGSLGRDFGRDSDINILIILQLVWAMAGQFSYTMISSQELLYITPSSLMLMCLHVPRKLFLWVLVPVNAAACYMHHTSLGVERTGAAARVGLQAGLILLLYLTRDGAETRSYTARLQNERERITALRKRLWADAQRSSFQGMLDSVFDASCTCSSAGKIVSSTPHMDMILLGQGTRKDDAGGLSGMSLSSFAPTDGEKARLKHFLASVSQGTAAQKIQLSLRRQSAAGGSSGTALEVTASGITMPSETKVDGEATLFIGLQLSLGVVPEAEDLGENSPEAPNLDDVMNLPPLPEKDMSLESVEGILKPTARARSLMSAPPIMECQGFPVSVAGDPCEDGDGDCLPGTTVVRIEGKGAPCRLDTVEPGQKVLCFDHLTGGLKHVEIVEVERHDAETPDLVEVTLDDGTELQMTTDHPVFVDDDSEQAHSRTEHPIRAGELKEGQHKVAVLKVVHVPVKKVEQVQNAGPTTIMSVSVHQPQRHSLFVAPGADSVSQSVAVASASMTDPQAMIPLEYRLKNTFIDLREDASPRMLRRTSSAPPGALESILEGVTPAEFSSISPSALAAHGQGEPTPRRKMPSSKASTASYGTYASSIASRASRASEAAAIILGKGVEDRRVRGWTINNTASLSEIMQARAAGLKSLGSAGHEEGWCYPCLMENWHNSDRPCRFGIGCSRCHEPHNRRQFKKARYAKPRLVGPMGGPRLPDPAPVGRID